MEKRIARQEKILDRQLEWIRASDSKVPPLTILNAAMLAAVATLAPPFKCWDIQLVVFAGLYFLGLGGSLSFLIYSIWPRMGRTKGSIIYFGSIGNMNARAYRRAVKRCSDESYFSDLIEQCYRNAKIARLKFIYVQRATFALLISLLPWGPMIWWFLTTGGC